MDEQEKIKLSDVFRLIDKNWILCFNIKTKEIQHFGDCFTDARVNGKLNESKMENIRKNLVYLPTYEKINHKDFMTFYVKEIVEDKAIRKQLFDILRNHDYLDKFIAEIQKLDLYEDYLCVTEDFYCQLVNEWLNDNNIIL